MKTVNILFTHWLRLLGTIGANAPRENSSVGASHLEEFEPKITSTAVSSQLEKYNYIQLQHNISANCPAIQVWWHLRRSFQLQADFVPGPVTPLAGTWSPALLPEASSWTQLRWALRPYAATRCQNKSRRYRFKPLLWDFEVAFSERRRLRRAQLVSDAPALSCLHTSNTNLDT